ncbi:cytochrome P450 [Hysterangium stoloniferum]|nr:cytochrome P450 [Hysterangium stoloniferum]
MDQPTLPTPYLFISIALASSLALLLKSRFSPRKLSLHDLNGPAPSSWLVGNMHSLTHQENVGDVDAEYIKEYGLAFKLKGVFHGEFLYLADPQVYRIYVQIAEYNMKCFVISRACTMSSTRLAIPFTKRELPGCSAHFWVQTFQEWKACEDHARHRKIILPGFSQSALKEFVPIFLQVAQKVVEKWRDLLQEGQQQSTVVDIHTWLSKLTLDAVGQGVLSYDFGALSDTPGDFAKPRHFIEILNVSVDIFHQPSDIGLAIVVLFGYLPAWVVSILLKVTMGAAKRVTEFRAVSNKITLDIVQREMASLEGGLPQGKDIMSSLLRANMSETAKNKMSTEELLSQMSALTVAGHDTTTNTLAWLFYEISRRPEVQNKLREEINATRAACAGNELGVNDFESMPYTIAVIKETLRYYPIAAHNAREAGRDELIPLSRPVKTAAGEEIAAIPIKKGQRVFASIWGYNRIKELWGEDAEQWNPERFMGENLNLRPQRGLGVYANLATFSSGVHSCVGWRFAVLELQAILIVLIQNFEFSPAPHNPVMRQVMAPTLVPMVKGEEKRGSQMPMSISAIN